MSYARLGLVVLLILVWGFNFVIIQLGLQGMPPLFMAFGRFFLTSIPAIFFFKRPAIPFQGILSYGLLLFAMQFACFFVGMSLGVPPGLASILMQLHVFFSLAYSVFIFHEHISRWQVIGALLSFSGIAYAATQISGQLSWIGFILIIAAAATWGTGTALSKTFGKVEMLSLVVWGSQVAWPPLLVLSLLLEGPTQILHSLGHFSWTSLGALCYLTYLATFFGYGLWSFLIYHLPLSQVVPFTLLIPVVAMVSSALVFQEPLPQWKIISAACVIGGLSINFLATRLMQGLFSKKISKS